MYVAGYSKAFNCIYLVGHTDTIYLDEDVNPDRYPRTYTIPQTSNGQQNIISPKLYLALFFTPSRPDLQPRYCQAVTE
jgi:hypothetical protein